MTLTPMTATVPTDFGCSLPGGPVLGVVSGAVTGTTSVELFCAVNATLSGTNLGLRFRAVRRVGGRRQLHLQPSDQVAAGSLQGGLQRPARRVRPSRADQLATASEPRSSVTGARLSRSLTDRATHSCQDLGSPPSRLASKRPQKRSGVWAVAPVVAAAVLGCRRGWRVVQEALTLRRPSPETSPRPSGGWELRRPERLSVDHHPRRRQDPVARDLLHVFDILELDLHTPLVRDCVEQLGPWPCSWRIRHPGP